VDYSFRALDFMGVNLLFGPLALKSEMRDDDTVHQITPFLQYISTGAIDTRNKFAEFAVWPRSTTPPKGKVNIAFDVDSPSRNSATPRLTTPAQAVSA
jgi:hypothetical protein